MKIKLSLNPVSGRLAMPACEVELEPAHILCNDVTFPWERHPYNMRLWVIGNEYGPMGAVWASHESDALDALCDAGLAGGILIDEKDADDETTRIGNAGEPASMDYCWMQTVRLSEAHDCKLIAMFAEAKGATADTLANI